LSLLNNRVILVPGIGSSPIVEDWGFTEYPICDILGRAYLKVKVCAFRYADPEERFNLKQLRDAGETLANTLTKLGNDVEVRHMSSRSFPEMKLNAH
jgi:hypothetical protein